MSPDHDVSPVGESSPASAQSPGSMIRQGRDRLHVSLDELAALTKLSYHTLEALESDSYSALLEPVYVRGYYRKCAKVLNLPEQTLLDAYQSRVAPKSPEAPAKIRLASGADLGSSNRLPIALAIGAALAAVVVCAILWIARSGSNSVPSLPVEVSMTPAPATEAAAPATPAPAAGESVTVPATELVAPPTPASTEPAGTAPAASPEAAPAPAAAAPAVTAPTPATPAAPASLVLSFSATSWVRVSDAKGQTAIDGLMRAGESKAIEGQPPFSVFLGNGSAAKVEYQGAVVDITRYVRDNKTARFTVPATP